MAKSKRSKVVTLSKTSKKTRPAKVAHLDLIRQCVDKYEHIYMIKVHNMRNNLLKQVRTDWESSKIFFGKNKIVNIALGRTSQDEYRPELNKLGPYLKGADIAVLFTDSDSKEVLEYFARFQVAEFARSGFVSTVDFTIPAGPLPDMPFSMETSLRQLGMMTKLNKGVIEVEMDHRVCSVGETLTPEQCRLLKIFAQMIATFKIDVQCSWTNGKFTEIGQ